MFKFICVLSLGLASCGDSESIVDALAGDKTSEAQDNAATWSTYDKDTIFYGCTSELSKNNRTTEEFDREYCLCIVQDTTQAFSYNYYYNNSYDCAQKMKKEIGPTCYKKVVGSN